MKTAKSISHRVRFITIGGARTAYLDEGSGRAIIFIHGWSMNKSYWSGQLEVFSQAYRTIAYDLRGMGESEGGDEAYDFAGLVTHLHDFTAALGIEFPAICGHSMGGALALQYAETYGREISLLILADASLPRAGDEQVLETFRAAVNAGQFAQTAPYCETLFYSQPFIQRSPAAIAVWKTQYLSNRPAPLVNGLNAWVRREDPVPRLTSVPVATLLIRGSLDSFVPPSDLETLARIPGSRRSVIEGAGHTCMQEIPEAFNFAVRDFLQSVVQAPPGGG